MEPKFEVGDTVVIPVKILSINTANGTCTVTPTIPYGGRDQPETTWNLNLKQLTKHADETAKVA